MTYLELCQMVARESGTLSGVVPTAVTGQTGRLAKVVAWTSEAWRQIQTMHATWRWMRAEFSASLTIGQEKHTASDLSVNARFADWIWNPGSVENRSEAAFHVYRTSEGVSDEYKLRYMRWEDYRDRFLRGEQTDDRPIYYTVSPALELCVGPAPNVAYTIRGEYRKSPQVLTADGTVPEMPARFHELIAWRALALLHQHDEGDFSAAMAAQNFRSGLDDLRRDQLPPVVIGARPIA